MGERDHDEDGVEELGEDIIVAQETAAHAPAPRAQVTTDHPSIVIAPHADRLGRVPTVPPLRRSERTEKTVVIRDRKSLERLRREASRAPRGRRRSSSRTITLVGVAVLASLAAGTLLATIANSTSSDDTASSSASVGASEPRAIPEPSQAAPEVVDLEDLPVVKTKRKKRTSGE